MTQPITHGAAQDGQGEKTKPQSRASFQRRQVISKMMLNHSDCNYSGSRIELQAQKKDSSPDALRNALHKQSLGQNPLNQGVHSNSVAESPKSQKQQITIGSSNLPRRLTAKNTQPVAGSRPKHLNHQQTSELTEQDSSEVDDARMPSRCESEVLDQRYQIDSVNHDSKAESLRHQGQPQLASEGCEHIHLADGNDYEPLGRNSSLARKANQIGGQPGSRIYQQQQQVRERSVRSRSHGGGASSGSTKHRKKPAFLKMITFEATEIADASLKITGIGNRRRSSNPSKIKAVSRGLPIPTPTHANAHVCNPAVCQANCVFKQHDFDLKVSRMNIGSDVEDSSQPSATLPPKPNTGFTSERQSEQAEQQKITFLNRQKTKLINQGNSDQSIDCSYAEEIETKSITAASGQDRSNTSHLNVKLPPTMGTKPNKAGLYIKRKTRVEQAKGLGVSVNAVKVSGKAGGPQKPQPTRAHTQKEVVQRAPLSDSASNQIHGGSSNSQKASSREDLKAKIAQAQGVRRMLTTKTQHERPSQKIPIPIFSNTSPNSKRDDSKKDADEDDNSVTDGDFKNFIIESSSPKRQHSPDHHKNEHEKLIQPKVAGSAVEMPPQAVQRVSFGSLPQELGKLTSMQRASLLNEKGLRKHFANKNSKNRLSQDSHYKAVKFYASKAPKNVIPKPNYKATAKIKPKSQQPRGEKTSTTDGKVANKFSKPIAQKIVVKAHTLIESIASNESLQVVFMKLWGLSAKSEYIIQDYFDQKQGRTVLREREPESIREQAVKLLSMRTVHQLIASISIGILLIKTEALCINDSIFLLKILSKDDQKKQRGHSKALADSAEPKNDKRICSFDQFKLIVLSLFGENIFTLNERAIDATLRKTYKQITVSAPPVFEALRGKSRCRAPTLHTLNDSLMMHESDDQSRMSKTSTAQPASDSAATFGMVKELELLRLTDLVKMLRQQAQLLKQPSMVTTMEFVLKNLNLAVYKEVKYIDYRSAFTTMQRVSLDSREVTFQEQAMKKYLYHNPWDSWKPRNAVDIQKPASCQAVDPRKIVGSSTPEKPLQEQNVQPKVASRGRMQSFKFATTPSNQAEEAGKNTEQAEDEPAGSSLIAQRGMLVKIEDLVRPSTTTGTTTQTNRNGFLSLNRRLKRNEQAKREVFSRTLDVRSEAFNCQRSHEEARRLYEENHRIYDPIEQHNDGPMAKLLQSLQANNQLDAAGRLEELIRPIPGGAQLVTSVRNSRPASTFKTQRQQHARNTPLQTYDGTIVPTPQHLRPKTQERGRRSTINQYTMPIKSNEIRGDFTNRELAQTPKSISHRPFESALTSNQVDCDTYMSQMRFANQYKPSVTGPVSNNPKTGRTLVDFDFDSATLRVSCLENRGKEISPTLMSQTRHNNQSQISQISNFLSTIDKQPLQGTYSGGGVIKSSLGDRIKLDPFTGQQHTKYQLLQYPMPAGSAANKETITSQRKPTATSQIAREVARARNESQRKMATQPVSPIPINLVNRLASMQQSGRVTPELAIDGLAQPILTQESRRSPTSGRGGVHAAMDRATAELMAKARANTKMGGNISMGAVFISPRSPVHSSRRVSQMEPTTLKHGEELRLDHERSNTEKPSQDDITQDQDYRRDSTLDMMGFSQKLNTLYFDAGDVRSRRGTEVLPSSFNIAGVEREGSFKMNAKPISLNIEAVIKTKAGFQQENKVVSQGFLGDDMKQPDLQKTTTLLLKH